MNPFLQMLSGIKPAINLCVANGDGMMPKYRAALSTKGPPPAALRGTQPRKHGNVCMRPV